MTQRFNCSPDQFGSQSLSPTMSPRQRGNSRSRSPQASRRRSTPVRSNFSDGLESPDMSSIFSHSQGENASRLSRSGRAFNAGNSSFNGGSERSLEHYDDFFNALQVQIDLYEKDIAKGTRTVDEARKFITSLIQAIESVLPACSLNPGKFLKIDVSNLDRCAIPFVKLLHKVLDRPDAEDKLEYYSEVLKIIDENYADQASHHEETQDKSCGSTPLQNCPAYHSDFEEIKPTSPQSQVKGYYPPSPPVESQGVGRQFGLEELGPPMARPRGNFQSSGYNMSTGTDRCPGIMDVLEQCKQPLLPPTCCVKAYKKYLEATKSICEK